MLSIINDIRAHMCSAEVQSYRRRNQQCLWSKFGDIYNIQLPHYKLYQNVIAKLTHFIHLPIVKKSFQIHDIVLQQYTTHKRLIKKYVM